MNTVRIRLTEEHKEHLQRIARRDHRSMTGVIRNWIEADKAKPAQAEELFSNKYIVKEEEI